MKADLHIHSNVSDCSLTKTEILQLAQQKGLTHIAFTEHDTTLKSEEYKELSKQYGIHVFKGIEISAFDFETGTKAHILGYDYRTTHHLENLCKPTLEKRHQNCIKQIEILQGLGYQISVENILPYAPYGTIYKQHILDYLLRTNQSEAMFGKIYKEIFKNKGPCDFDIQYVSAKDAVTAIVADGGIPVLAHPLQQNNLYMVKYLLECGLKGLEYNHPSSKISNEEIRKVGEQYQLFLTGGSDFHGKYESVTSPLGSFLSEENFVEMLLKPDFCS